MKNTTIIWVAGVLGLLFLILVLLVLTFDVAPIGPEGTSIGLSHINRYAFDLWGVSIFWYSITDWLGIAAIAVAFVFAFMGFIQLIKRRSFLKVDKTILWLGGLYVIVIGLYVFFDVVIVNYRPIIMPGSVHPEASFPSSHTMVVCVIMGSALVLLKQYIKNECLRIALQVICAIVILITVCGRLISCAHWFTDILGGLLISTALVFFVFGDCGKDGISEYKKVDKKRIALCYYNI